MRSGHACGLAGVPAYDERSTHSQIRYTANINVGIIGRSFLCKKHDWPPYFTILWLETCTSLKKCSLAPVASLGLNFLWPTSQTHIRCSWIDI